MAQSHAPLATTTRNLIPTPSTAKLHGQNRTRKKLLKMQMNRPEASRWARVNEETTKCQARGAKEGAKNVSATDKSTYNSVSKARESKMPSGSSDRSLNLRNLKPARNEIEKKEKKKKYSVLAQSHAPLATTTRTLIPTPSTAKLHGRNRARKQLLKLIYRAQASQWAR